MLHFHSVIARYVPSGARCPILFLNVYLLWEFSARAVRTDLLCMEKSQFPAMSNISQSAQYKRHYPQHVFLHSIICTWFGWGRDIKKKKGEKERGKHQKKIESKKKVKRNLESDWDLEREPFWKRASSPWNGKKVKNDMNETEVQKGGVICICENIYFCFIDYPKVFKYVNYNKLWKIIKEMGIPDHLNCLLRKLYACQKETVRIEHGKKDWFQTWKGVRQGCILSPCLFNV